MQRGSDCTVLTATGLVNGEWQILTPYRIETPKPINIKFGTGDYVGQTIPRAKFGANPSTDGSITRFHARMCLVGVTNVEINTKPLFMPPNVTFWQKQWKTENALQWTLNRHRSPMKVIQ